MGTFEYYPPGSLVRVRGRDWAVLPNQEADVIRLRPIDGTEDQAIGLYLPLEGDSVKPAIYPLPDEESVGDLTGGLLLYDAARLSLRSGAGAFRSLGRLSVSPRPYQFVPLIMALRQSPVRLLIADDVGVGKTIEAAMIAREMLDAGLISRIAVVCAPHLCGQWEQELREKFDIQATVIQPARVERLKRELPRQDVGLYQYYKHLILSIDYIKSEQNRDVFLANAPDFIIVDEAHTMARPRGQGGRTQHQRFSLLSDLVADPKRHVVLTTATPHSGIEESFRSLLGLLNPKFDVPEQEQPQLDREQLLPHLVQRRRQDLVHWMGADTPFPDRKSDERIYQMSPTYQKLYLDVLEYCRQSVAERPGLRAAQQRVRYWAAIAILRCLLSSPAAAEAMLQRRKGKVAARAGADDMTDDEVDGSFADQILDSSTDDQAPDYVPSAALGEDGADLSDSELRSLDGFLKRAIGLRGLTEDRKLMATVTAVSELLSEGYHPIVYCRFIDTAVYVAEQLQIALAKQHKGLFVRSVTGGDGDSEQRAELVSQMAVEPTRVLVATDCLSEGINLQDSFDAVLHYDLPWNPNRLEQREGRVDRYGQQRDVVKTSLLFGMDNQIDQVVMRVLIRKAQTIRAQLGVSVPVPVDSEQVVQAVIDSVLLGRGGRGQQLELALEDSRVSMLHEQWDEAAKHAGEAQAFFAQHAIQPGEVARELDEAYPVLGSADDIQRFVENAAVRFGGSLKQARKKGVWDLDVGGEQLDKLRLRVAESPTSMSVAFQGVPPEGVELLGRNSPAVATMVDSVLAQALVFNDTKFARLAAVYTNVVTVRTCVALLRLRYQLRGENDQFAEEIVAAAFERDGTGIKWLNPIEKKGGDLLQEARGQTSNMPDVDRAENIRWGLGALGKSENFESIIQKRQQALHDAHSRLRTTLGVAGLVVEPHRPPDVLGCYVLVPTGGR